ncbi:GDSL esterase/lipase At5g03610-like [Glycine soja]|uniref:GDSL esterase/lipase At5g03610-like n=1 Tax=Glycine soja TaxID=3848 RepID=UPI00103B3D6B|nr:GDSL esterase/lipase At5g03610-like [Glycine soja]
MGIRSQLHPSGRVLLGFMFLEGGTLGALYLISSVPLDVLVAAIGRPEHPGCVCAAKVDVTIKQYFGSAPWTSHSASSLPLDELQQLTQQIRDQLKESIIEKVTSQVVVSPSKPPSKLDPEDLPGFMESLVKQMSVNLKRIHSLGIKKVAVGLLQPIGCLPVLNVISFRTNCIGLLNVISKDHNKMLLKAVQELNKEAADKSVFITLDLYNSFLSAIETMQKKRAEKSTLMNPLQPCCEGNNLEDSCGSVDDEGSKKYSLCENPKHSFFWDTLHPSQNGWFAVYTQ